MTEQEENLKEAAKQYNLDEKRLAAALKAHYHGMESNDFSNFMQVFAYSVATYRDTK